MPQANLMARSLAVRSFAADVSVVNEEKAEVESPEQRNARLGIDAQFNKEKHAHVLMFPWNFPQILDKIEAQHRPLSDGSYWARFVRNSGAENDINNLYREFHQFVALPDADGINKICEAKLAEKINASVKRIHFTGLDLEMANLTVHQPSIKVLKCELTHGLTVDRMSNGTKEDWNVKESTLMGAPLTYYIPQNDTRSVFDNFDQGKKPYTIAVTAVVESPMKLFVQNQNYSKILFGTNDKEHVKNIVRFEANVYWTDLLKVLPVNNKPSLKWRITDWNNLMNENVWFPDPSQQAASE